MISFYDLNKKTMPQQVYKNTKDIEELKQQIGTWYNTKSVLTKESTSIPRVETDVPADVQTGYLLTAQGLLFKILRVYENIVYLYYYATLPSGAQGVGIEKIENTGYTDGDGFTITHVDVTLTNGEVESFDVKAKQGERGLDGSGINPNLLINGDFRVNQRGKTSYTHTGEQYDYTYFIDRWFAWGGNPFTFDVSTKTLTPNTSNTGNSILSQWIEDISGILGKTITYSVSTNDTVYSKTLNIPTTLSNNVMVGELSTSFGKLRVWYNNNRLRFDIIVSYNQSIVLNYAKVEIGSMATAFSPRPYAEELALCLRYYQNINTVSSLLYARTTDQLRAMINFKAEMRTTPTLTQLNTIRVYGINEGTVFTQTSVGISGSTAINKEGAMVALSNYSGLTEKYIYQLDLGVSTEPIFTADAEIY